ncbi:hypothetical protein HS088_TW17G00030 [Tripterygium wilfordii]|uniref:Uncharacterized protein n=1 Tax=Tripterygium wilfordii TaxID=458696 RepID=A0A7J7CEE1_TRIWF|nr:uncharacterized protein LOC119982332 [Tripterygium wilfordii]KAF5732503.1 hypothetical protein HS088_TW17G00030 [Tripterygium wilfordii]
MALNLSLPLPPCLIPKHKHQSRLSSFSSSSSSSSYRASAQSERTQGGVTEEESSAAFSGTLSSVRTRLDLLEQLTSTSSSVDGGYESDGHGLSRNLTIREQLAQLVGEREGDFSIPLGKDLKKVSAKFLTISQKRNIRRQAYLDEVSQRNDSVFFATIGAFVILPPFIILGIAIITGYVQLFP